jgi:hypothetical protein
MLSQNIKRVAKKLLKVVRNKKFFKSVQNLGRYHYDIINDKAVVFEEKSLKRSRFYCFDPKSLKTRMKLKGYGKRASY